MLYILPQIPVLHQKNKYGKIGVYVIQPVFAFKWVLMVELFLGFISASDFSSLHSAVVYGFELMFGERDPILPSGHFCF